MSSDSKKYPELELAMMTYEAKLEISWWREGGLFTAELCGACPIIDDVDGHSVEDILQEMERRLVDMGSPYYDPDYELEMDFDDGDDDDDEWDEEETE